MSLRTTAKPNAPGDRVALVVHRCTAVASWRADRATVIEINGQGVCLVSFDAFPFDDDMTRDDVKRALVQHDGMPPDINPFRSGRTKVRLSGAAE